MFEIAITIKVRLKFKSLNKILESKNMFDEANQKNYKFTNTNVIVICLFVYSIV